MTPAELRQHGQKFRCLNHAAMQVLQPTIFWHPLHKTGDTIGIRHMLQFSSSMATFTASTMYRN